MSGHREVFMPRLRLEMDQETYDALAAAAVHDLRSLPDQGVVLLRRQLGLPVPYPCRRPAVQMTGTEDLLMEATK